MKHKLSISVEESTVAKVQAQLRTGKYRSKSHFIEFAVNEFLEEE